MMDLEMTEEEFLLVAAVLFWSAGMTEGVSRGFEEAEGSSASVDVLCRRMQEKLLQETLDMLRVDLTMEDAALRLSKHLMLLPPLQVEW